MKDSRRLGLTKHQSNSAKADQMCSFKAKSWDVFMSHLVTGVWLKRIRFEEAWGYESCMSNIHVAISLETPVPSEDFH